MQICDLAVDVAGDAARMPVLAGKHRSDREADEFVRPDRLHDAALHLAFDEERVDLGAAVVNGDVIGDLHQSGVAIEVIAVDDRSSDRTGEILARLAAEDARVRVTRIETLPEGWLGKCHACHTGARLATGFLDAGLIDRMLVFTAPVELGGGPGMFAHPVELPESVDARMVGPDILTEFELRNI